MGRTFGIGIALIVSLGSATGSAIADDAAEFFESKVRPVLATRCISCHGPDKQKAGLRLDTAEGMKKGGESGAVIAPGKPEESRLVEAVKYHDPDLQMPPKGKLPAAEVEALSRWVKSGAVWPEVGREPKSASTEARAGKVSAEDRAFWSFRPVAKVEPPAVKDAEWSKSAIDRFVFAAMTSKGLSPSHRADKRTLIRRVAFDLTGLPPTPEEVEAFLKDGSPEAYAKVVDRLLASPRYGERWARHWLDLARYGEDQAHTFQARVFPQGYLYRDWVVKSLNADLPYDQFLIQQIAADQIDGPDKQERLAALGFFGLGASYYSGSPTAIADERDDKLDTLCRSMLGLTVACARCHDHKFDPIPTADYYSLASIIASTDYKEYPKAPADVVAKYDQAQAEIKAKTAEVASFVKAEAAKLPERLASRETGKYVVAAWRLANARKVDPKLTTAVFAKEEGLRAAWIDRWSEYLYDKKGGEGRAHLARWRQLVEKEDPKADLRKVAGSVDAVKAVADGLQSYLGATLALRDALKAFEAADPGTAADRPKLREADKKAIEEIAASKGLFAVPAKEAEALFDDATKTALKAKRAEMAKLKESAPAKYPVIHAVADVSSPTDLRVHLRGNPANLGEPAPRGFLSVLSPDGSKPFTKGSGRLELAAAIASKDNPLTARVIINRLWAQHFGRGLVATPSNFGAMGERPSHPELLDWLAVRLVDKGWSLKSLHRDILLSSAYSQASDPSPRAREADPDNVYLSHANRRRLEVEAWRDAMLAVTAELDPALGGPSVELSSPDNHRRTLYAKVSRHRLDPLLRQFDFPDPNLTSDKRTVSTVPLQGLFVLNSNFMASRSESLASRLTKDGKEPDDSRIRRAFLLLYGRPAADDEVAMGVEFLKGSGEPSKEAPSGWVQYAQVLLGANEFLFID
jgi:cytochrome c553